MYQLPLIIPQSDWRAPRIADLPDWKNSKRIGIDTETDDPYLRILGPGVRRGAKIAGISFAIEDSNHKYYIPLRHKGGDNVEDVNQALGYFREQAKGFEGEIVGANLGYDLDFLAEEQIIFPNIKGYLDVQIAEPLIDDLAMSYSLETICNKWLGIGKNEGLLKEAAIAYGIKDVKKGIHLLPARFVGPYAEDDSNHPLLALRRQEKEIDQQDIWRIFRLESALLPVLVDMRRRGVRISLDKLSKIEKWSVEEEKKALAIVKNITGVEIPFNAVWRAEAIAPAIESLGIKVPLTPKTKKPSIQKDFLNNIKHPAMEAILRARKVNKIRTTFCQSIRDHAIKDRIHCTFNQLRFSTEEDEDGEGEGARYGRCSSRNPNMQQQPAKDPEIGPLWRSVYIPEEGEFWCSADYSAQEPRQAVHYAVSTRLGNSKVRTPAGSMWVDADESAAMMAERYRNDPATDVHQELANIIVGRIANEYERKEAKIIFLGLSYGMGGAKLCRSLGLPTIMAVRDPLTGENVEINTEDGRRIISQGGRIYEAAGTEGQTLLDKFDANVPFVRALSRICTKAANKYGYIRTQEGRKCRFPKDEVGNIMDAHKAMNKIVQGSAADQTKKAMIALYKEKVPMTLQVHDEICCSVKNKEQGEMIAKIMEEAYILKIPNRVDLEIGKDWGSSH